MIKKFTVTIDMELDYIERVIVCTVFPPHRETWTEPRIPMQMDVDSIEPDLGRELNDIEYDDVYNYCKSEIVRRELA